MAERRQSLALIISETEPSTLKQLTEDTRDMLKYVSEDGNRVKSRGGLVVVFILDGCLQRYRAWVPPTSIISDSRNLAGTEHVETVGGRDRRTYTLKYGSQVVLSVFVLLSWTTLSSNLLAILIVQSKSSKCIGSYCINPEMH